MISSSDQSVANFLILVVRDLVWFGGRMLFGIDDGDGVDWLIIWLRSSSSSDVEEDDDGGEFRMDGVGVTSALLCCIDGFILYLYSCNLVCVVCVFCEYVCVFVCVFVCKY